MVDQEVQKAEIQRLIYSYTAVGARLRKPEEQEETRDGRHSTILEQNAYQQCHAVSIFGRFVWYHKGNELLSLVCKAI